MTVVDVFGSVDELAERMGGSVDAVTGAAIGPYQESRLKPAPHGNHSVILRWLGDGQRRRLLDVGAADGLLSRKLTDRGWRVTAIEGDPCSRRPVPAGRHPLGQRGGCAEGLPLLRYQFTVLAHPQRASERPGTR